MVVKVVEGRPEAGDRVRMRAKRACAGGLALLVPVYAVDGVARASGYSLGGPAGATIAAASFQAAVFLKLPTAFPAAPGS